MNRKDHWDTVYATKSDGDLSWTQQEPSISLALIAQACPTGRVIDVGGGTSVLADRLLTAGYEVSVLDISSAALDHARAKLGPHASVVNWIVGDVTAGMELGVFDIWHDRAVFHFLTAPESRVAYIKLLERSVSAGGHAIIATFALDGPEECSGLPVSRYSGADLAADLGPGLELLKTVPEIHTTPWGSTQSFQYSLFRRTR